MVAGAKQRYVTLSIAKGMETAQLNLWQGEKRSEHAVFKLLKLDEDGDKLFQNPLVNTWASYVKKVDLSHSDESVFLTLKTRYGEADLAQMLLRKSESTESLAARLENVQLNTWIAEGKTADDIFKLLNLQKQNENLLESAEFSAWTSYVARVEKGDVDGAVMSVLKTHYDGKTLAAMLDAAKANPGTKSVASRLQEELWLSEGKDIFKLWRLDQTDGDIFKTSEFATWASYVMKVNTRDKTADEFQALSVLKRRFGAELEPALRISAAMVFHKSDKALVSLQDLQFKQWLKRGETPDSVSRWFRGGDFDKRSTGVTLGYYDFYKANSSAAVCSLLAPQK